MEELAKLLAEHSHDYDSDCGMDYGCTCDASGDYDDNIDHATHLAQVLTEKGYHL